MKGYTRKERYLSRAEEAARSMGFRSVRLEPAATGKKGMVYIVHTEEGKSVLRVYRNPFYLSKVIIIYGILDVLGVDLSPEIKKIKLFPCRGVLGCILEEHLDGLNKCLSGIYEFFKKLGELHVKSSIDFRPLCRIVTRKWKCKALSNIKFLKRMRMFPDLLEEVAEIIESVDVLHPVSLCHSDIGGANSGCSGDKVKLFDWDRASLSLPHLDLLQALYWFSPPDRPAAFEAYFEASGFGEIFKEQLLPASAIFLVSRMKKEVKRNRKDKLDELGRMMKILVNGYCPLLENP